MKSLDRNDRPLVVIAVAAVVGLAVVGFGFRPTDLPAEIAKSLLQLLVVVVLGGIVTRIAANSSAERERYAEISGLRHEYAARLNEAYSEAKRIRRLLRAHSPTAADDRSASARTVDETVYHEHMSRLSEAQLSLEVLRQDFKTNQAQFENSDAIERVIRSMENYLNKLVDEWEHKSSNFSGSPPSCQLSELPRLQDFLGDYGDSKFRSAFVENYYKAIAGIRERLSGPSRTSAA